MLDLRADKLPLHPRWKMGNGDHERIRTSDPKIHTTSALAAAHRAFVVWTVPSPWATRPLGAAHPVSTPSTDFSEAWLGIGMLKISEAFPDFEQIDCNL